MILDGQTDRWTNGRPYAAKGDTKQQQQQQKQTLTMPKSGRVRGSRNFILNADLVHDKEHHQCDYFFRSQTVSL